MFFLHFYLSYLLVFVIYFLSDIYLFYFIEHLLLFQDTLIEKLRLKNTTLKVLKKKLQLQLKQVTRGDIFILDTLSFNVLFFFLIDRTFFDCFK